MRSTVRRLAVIGAAMLLGVGVAAGWAASASAATAPDAHLAAAAVTFTTGNDNKDFDTLVRAQVETPAGRVATDFSDVGTEYKDNSVRGPFMMRTDTGVTAAMLSSGLVRITIDPVGHDTWHFSYGLTLFFSDGTSFVIQAGNLSLTESRTQLTTPFTLTTQVAVPDVIGSSPAGAQSTLRAAGLNAILANVVDPTCNFINLVKFENPGAGTVVNVGTTVTITVGQRPRICP
ncbi:PASTA domain-containing protein [Actinocrispum wychmicini]|uniref:PASTA domain-containing protein n=1 Tax=Actinocrispum wychmicini TaxID=1213861 RepID=A0A4R2JIF1_9PSEU|nr:PASTA domain-containing protein [Actinocrispum wychmicini]TCO59691.1 PASTA domain-containing protein [Actinocrispum wychmicini]